MADLLVELGVPRDRLILAACSRSTREEAGIAAGLCAVHGVHRLVAVTSSYHVPRARRVLEEVLGPEHVSVHGTTAFLALASAAERTWILAGEPGASVFAAERRIERRLTFAEAALAPLPRRLRWRFEVAAARALRRA